MSCDCIVNGEMALSFDLNLPQTYSTSQHSLCIKIRLSMSLHVCPQLSNVEYKVFCLFFAPNNDHYPCIIDITHG